MVVALVKLGIEVRLEDILEDGQLAYLFALERRGIIQHLAVAVAEDVGGEPALQAEQARLDAGREQGLHEGLTRFVVLARQG